MVGKDAQAADAPLRNAASFLIYGFPPNSNVTLSVGGNRPSARTVDANGCYVGSLGTDWPPGEYTVTVAGANGSARTVVRK